MHFSFAQSIFGIINLSLVLCFFVGIPYLLYCIWKNQRIFQQQQMERLEQILAAVQKEKSSN